MSKQVFPTAPSPTTTHFIVATTIVLIVYVSLVLSKTLLQLNKYGTIGDLDRLALGLEGLIDYL
jgi:hypothetical protein